MLFGDDIIMNWRRDVMMILIKYAAYIGIMVAIIFEKNNYFLLSLILCSFLIIVGSLRQFIIEDEFEYLRKYTFILDLLIVTALGVFDYSGMYIIGYFIIIVEGILICPYLFGIAISGICVIFYNLIYWKMNYIQSVSVLMLPMVYNSLTFIFFIAISFSAKKQIEQREKLEDTVNRLEELKMELEETNERLLISNKKNHELTILEERNRMAREIHDTLAHTLTTIVVEIEAGKKLMVKGNPAALEELEKAQNQARLGLDEVRHSIKNLRSGVLSKEGFENALNTTLSHLKTIAEIDIEFEMDKDISINEEYEMVLFRIIQEAATNSYRHGKSKKIYIGLHNIEDGIRLTIEDDGVGCDNIKAGYGLIGMKERSKKLGGIIKIDSSHGKGFCINVTLPLKEAE
jgi:signal transduction histidine kinase